jgi:hypothetical protein
VLAPTLLSNFKQVGVKLDKHNKPQKKKKLKIAAVVSRIREQVKTK